MPIRSTCRSAMVVIAGTGLSLAASAQDLRDAAKSRLVAAGETPGSPQQSSFGPDMTPARELLEQGEAETVLEYLSLCSDFRELGDGDIEDWIAQIEDGTTPDFGANLMPWRHVANEAAISADQPRCVI